MIRRPFDELEVGERLVSRGRTITEADLVFFCYFTGNWEGLHADEEFARKTRFGTRIGSGRMLIALVSGLLPPSPDIELAFYGLDKVRFTAPVHIGDTIHYEANVVSKELRDDKYGVVSVEVRALNERNELLMVATERILVGRSRIAESGAH